MILSYPSLYSLVFLAIWFLKHLWLNIGWYSLYLVMLVSERGTNSCWHCVQPLTMWYVEDSNTSVCLCHLCSSFLLVLFYFLPLDVSSLLAIYDIWLLGEWALMLFTYELGACSIAILIWFWVFRNIKNYVLRIANEL